MFSAILDFSLDPCFCLLRTFTYTSLPLISNHFAIMFIFTAFSRYCNLSGHKKSNFCAHDRTWRDAIQTAQQGRTTVHWCWRGEAESRFKDGGRCRVTHPRLWSLWADLFPKTDEATWNAQHGTTLQPAVASEVPGRGSKLLPVSTAPSRLPLPNPASFPGWVMLKLEALPSKHLELTRLALW